MQRDIFMQAFIMFVRLCISGHLLLSYCGSGGSAAHLNDPSAAEP